MATEKLEITIQHVTSPDDFPEFLRVENAAFRGNELMGLMFSKGPNVSQEDYLAISVNTLVEAWRNDPSVHCLTAKLPSGKIVGIAKWNFFLDSGPQKAFPRAWPPGTNLELANKFFDGLEKARNTALEGKKHALMSLLAIDPEYQRNGIGGKLLQWGLVKCDQEGYECWIDASKFGKGLYEKYSWKEVEVLKTDLEKWGGTKGAFDITTGMVRHPQKIEEKQI